MHGQWIREGEWREDGRVACLAKNSDEHNGRQSVSEPETRPPPSSRAPAKCCFHVYVCLACSFSLFSVSRSGNIHWRPQQHLKLKLKLGTCCIYSSLRLSLSLSGSCLKLAPTFLRMKLSVWHSLSGCSLRLCLHLSCSEAALIRTKCPPPALARLCSII